MPCSHQQEYKKESEPGFAQRIVDVSSHPCAQSDVPSSPEITHRRGKPWLFEIVSDAHSKKAAHTNCDVNDARKVQIELNVSIDSSLEQVHDSRDVWLERQEKSCFKMSIPEGQ